jgi:hypothetical protein
MERTGDWGDAGEQQVQNSFARLILGISPDGHVSYTQYSEFYERVKAAQRTYRFATASLEKLQAEFDTFSVKIGRKKYDIHHFTDLNAYLQKIGSSLHLQGGVYGYAKEFILGRGIASKMGKYEVVVFEEEVLRSPNTITAMAAVIGEKEIFVRIEALSTIYYLKWGQAIENRLYGYYSSASVFHEVSFKVKSRVLELYGITDRESLRGAQEQFVQEMKETVLFHELGHGVIQHSILPIHAATFAESTKMFGEHIVTALLEILAELAPKKGSIHGPLYNFYEVAKKDFDRAERMYWMYISDTWFFDTPDTYMYLYSELMSLVMSYAINEKEELDFRRFTHLKLLNLAVKSVKEICTALEFYIRTHVRIDRKKIEKRIAKDHPNEPIQRHHYGYKVLFWSEVFDDISKNPEYKADIDALLKEEEVRVLKAFYKAVAGKNVVEGRSVRDYVSRKWLASRWLS